MRLSCVMDALAVDDDSTCLDEILVRKQIDGAIQDMAGTIADGTLAGEVPAGTFAALADSSIVGIEFEAADVEASAEGTEFVATSGRVRTPYREVHYRRQPPLSR